MMADDKHINVEVDGITFLSAGRYYDGINQWVSHHIKDEDPQAIDYAARCMAKLIPTHRAVLIPVPGHEGIPTNAMLLAQSLSSYTGIPVLDALRGKARESNYHAKYAGHPLTEDQLGFYPILQPPTNRLPLIIDGVVDSGVTAKAAYHALGDRGIVLSYAMSDTLLSNDLTQSTGMKR